MSGMMAMDPIESLDHDLKMAFVYGRIMLEHTRKMTELYHACVKENLKIHGEWGTTSHVLQAVTRISALTFTVFWFSDGHVYVYHDKNRYGTFESVHDVITYVTTGYGNLRVIDPFFFKERLKAVENLNRKIKQLMHSRLKIIKQLQKKRLGFLVSVDAHNIFNPIQGTRNINGELHHFYMFFDYVYDHTFNFSEFDSLNKRVNHVASYSVDTLFESIASQDAETVERIASQNAKTLKKSKSSPARNFSYWQRKPPPSTRT
jgi:hypothetical protein